MDFLDRIVIGDESLFHYYEPESKFHSSHWERKHECIHIMVECSLGRLCIPKISPGGLVLSSIIFVHININICFQR